ncbi:MAG: FAD-dependent monooxygenase [Gammaproteobacteria bacterium]|nr:FAD-dependent monooxygenase [Gammaproteobacteria bacterium]
MQQFDIAIVGGGMVGAALACALAPLGLSIAIVEKNAPMPYQPTQAMDLRVSAISIASQKLLEDVGAWQHIAQMRSCPYRYLETWEAQDSHLLFDSAEMSRAHLGHIVENRLIVLALWRQMNTFDNITVFKDATIERFEKNQFGYTLTMDDQPIKCRLLVGADGSNSSVRAAANIGITAWDYRQHAMLINITTQCPQQNITWQQFTASGPRALLPLAGNKASLVWYDSPQVIRQLSSLSPEQLKQRIIAEFPQRLGQFTVNDCGSFPLTRRHAQTYHKANVVLVGDAAHTINPLAGQGVNLGFKDVIALAKEIAQSHASDNDWWDQQTLSRYQKSRRPDNLLMQSAMDVFYLTFSNQKLPVKLLRNTILKLAEQSTWGKKQVMKYAMGL